jgi:mycothiol synthase
MTRFPEHLAHNQYGAAVPDRPDPARLATLVRRACVDPPTASELVRALSDPDHPTMVLGDEDRGVVAFGIDGDRGYVRLLAVDPDHRRRGLGGGLLANAEAELARAGARTVTVGADAPCYLWPGVDRRALGAVCLLERARYARVETNLNMDVDLTDLPPDRGGWRVAAAPDRSAVEAWAGTHWPWWRAEMVRAVDQAGLVLTEDQDGITAVCAHDVNRAGFVGPVASRPDLVGRGVGRTPLLGALHRMRTGGREAAEIAWVGPIAPYARIGATVGRTFLVYRKELS